MAYKLQPVKLFHIDKFKQLSQTNPQHMSFHFDTETDWGHTHALRQQQQSLLPKLLQK